MYKVKIIFLEKTGKKQRWVEGWIDTDNLDGDNLDAIISEEIKKEQNALDEDGIDAKVIKALISETHDITYGKYECGSCECFFDELDDGQCPFCSSGNWVEGGIDDSNGGKKCFNHCPKCNATDPDIEWGNKEWLDNEAYQSAKCNKCGCEFKEYYQYSDTEIDGE